MGCLWFPALHCLVSLDTDTLVVWEFPMNQIDTVCPLCGAIARILTDKTRVKTTCNNCHVSYMTTKSELRTVKSDAE